MWKNNNTSYNTNSDFLRSLSDRLFRVMADIVATEGYADAGYEFINIDDCWLDKERSYTGHLQPDPLRFPNGIKDLANYVSIPCQSSYCGG